MIGHELTVARRWLAHRSSRSGRVRRRSKQPFDDIHALRSIRPSSDMQDRHPTFAVLMS